MTSAGAMYRNGKFNITTWVTFDCSHRPIRVNWRMITTFTMSAYWVQYNAKIAIYELWFVNQLYFCCDLKRDWVVSRRRLLDLGWAAGQDADRRVKVHKHELFQGDHEPDPCARTNTLHLSLSARIWWQTLCDWHSSTVIIPSYRL